jgi:hypothetical protein
MERAIETPQVRPVPPSEDRTLYVDCDDTLIMWNLSDYGDETPRLTVNVWGPADVIPNQKNINTVRKFALLGYTIILWSKTGAKWARAVGQATGLDPLVTAYLTKPTYYLDDMEAAEWLGPRLWRAA